MKNIVGQQFWAMFTTLAVGGLIAVFYQLDRAAHVGITDDRGLLYLIEVVAVLNIGMFTTGGRPKNRDIPLLDDVLCSAIAMSILLIVITAFVMANFGGEMITPGIAWSMSCIAIIYYLAMYASDLEQARFDLVMLSFCSQIVIVKHVIAPAFINLYQSILG